MARHSTSQKLVSFSLRRSSWYVVVLGLVLFLLLRQLGALHLSFGVLKHVQWLFVTLAVAATLVSHTIAAGKYQLLAFHRLRYWSTLVVQLAALLTSRLLPAGLGGLGVNYVYLRQHRHTPAQAAVVVSVNNIIGVVGNCLLLVVLAALSHAGWRQLYPHTTWHSSWLIALLCLGVLALILVALNRQLRHGIQLVLSNFLRYRHHPLSLVSASLCSMAIALCYSAALWWSAKALGIALPFLSALLVMTIGVAAGSATPTPGGIGGAEAGLVAALSLTGLALDTALTLTLLYRLISFWLSLLIGAVALVAGSGTILPQSSG